MSNELIAPILSGSFVLAAAIATGVTAVFVARRNGDTSKAPTVDQAWAEADAARRQARAWERLYDLVRRAFKAYARRMHDRLGEDASLNESERAALDAPIPKE